MKWNDLTMKERSDLMSLFLKAGVGSLSDMKKIYDEGGGTLEDAAPSKPDITLEEYQHIIEALKHKIYYKK